MIGFLLFPFLCIGVPLVLLILSIRPKKPILIAMIILVFVALKFNNAFTAAVVFIAFPILLFVNDYLRGKTRSVRTVWICSIGWAIFIIAYIIKSRL